MLKQLAEMGPVARRRIRLLVALGVAVVLLVLAWQLLLVLIPLALSAVIASLLLPLVRLGERSPLARRWPRFNRALVAGFATLLGVAAVLGFLALVAYGLVGGGRPSPRPRPC